MKLLRPIAAIVIGLAFATLRQRDRADINGARSRSSSRTRPNRSRVRDALHRRTAQPVRWPDPLEQARRRRQHRHRGRRAFHARRLYADDGHDHVAPSSCTTRCPSMPRRISNRSSSSDQFPMVIAANPAARGELDRRRDRHGEINAEVGRHRDAEHHGAHRVRVAEGASRAPFRHPYKGSATAQ